MTSDTEFKEIMKELEPFVATGDDRSGGLANILVRVLTIVRKQEIAINGLQLRIQKLEAKR